MTATPHDASHPNEVSHPNDAYPNNVAQLVEVLASLVDVPSEGGSLNELDHALQCAAVLAARHPDDPGLIVAGLVHDIGHRFGDDEAHGRAGAAAVRGVLGARVADLVGLHVPAKRYLVSVDPSYTDVLSAESTTTLGWQGGRLAADEVAALRALPDWDAAVALRRADDAAKEPGRNVPSLDHWIPLLHSIAQETSP